MMLKLPVIDATSPSTNEALRSCLWKAGMGRMREIDDFVLGNPKSWMGTVIHDIIYQASKSSATFDVDTLWAEKIAEIIDRQRTHPLNSRFAIPEKWPGYHLLLAGVRRFVRRLAPTATRTAGNIRREVELYCYDNKMKGRPDYYDLDTLIDYKTGVITEPDNPLEPKDSYVRQLRIYAAIIFQSSGFWVKTASLMPMSGQSVTVEVQQEQCLAEAQDALGRLHLYNEAIKNSTVQPSPSVEECKYCPFQVVCPAFWSTADASWSETSNTQTVGGIMLRPAFGIRSTSDFSLNMEVDSGTMPAGEYTIRIGGAQLSSAGTILEGTELRISGLKKTSSGSALSGTPRTTVWRQDQIPQISS